MKNFLNLRQSASNQRKPASRGFTLLELLVVISIIGLLASIALVSLDSARKKTRDTQRLSDMAGIQKALRLYYENRWRLR
ncbi:MAG: fimbrial protein pilin [Parcubacteria group bacterium GW2011_GWC1_38_17]|nr:MAG: fimbrial protein pilin [Parcubacteria group bacterium GW2011_GWC1_38_17]